MAVDKDVLKQRIDAARTLRGITQVELNKLFDADGLGKHDVGRLERGELPLRRIHLDALVRHLRVPEWWFTADEIEFPDAQPGFAQIVEAAVRPIVREVLRPLEELAPPDERHPHSGRDPRDPDTPEEDPPPSGR